MKWIQAVLLAGTLAVALAQDPPAEQQDPAAESEQEQADAPDTVAPPESELTEAEKAAKAMADEDFKPGDEISEDYPIPLPADI